MVEHHYLSLFQCKVHTSFAKKQLLNQALFQVCSTALRHYLINVQLLTIVIIFECIASDS